ncbi:STAS domain-containing protein [Streptomyces sannanensis]|uniref:Anti-sigma factor antagonist n=1 Tax=Streptomyces sannanensis TaxID=285536 RepID=A0ABP6SLC7_9ACTN
MAPGVTGKPDGEDTRGPRFTVDVRSGPGTVVLALGGELDHDTAGALRDALTRGITAGADRILVDCSDLRFCDSTGLNALLRGRLAAQNAGIRLELVALQPPVARMFGITGADTVFRVHASLEEALGDRRQR